MTSIEDLFNSIKPAGDYTPIPTGTYEAEAIQGTKTESSKGTPCYKVIWRIEGGEHDGRRVFQDFWLTDRALPITRRDLAKLGITTGEQLNRSVAEGIVCKICIVKKRRDSGAEYNEVRSIEYLRTKVNPFIPEPPKPQPPQTTYTPEGASSDAVSSDPFNQKFFDELNEMENWQGGSQ